VFEHKHFQCGRRLCIFRWKLLSALNAVFFSVALGGSLAAGLVFAPSVYYGQPVYVVPEFLYGSVPLMFLFIFCFNLAISAFAVITLPGFLFFPLSTALLTLRAVLWGLILCPLPPGLFLVALPTMVLEGEAYVLAAAVGTTVEYSWLTQSKDLPRSKAFRDAFRRDMGAYVFVILLLLTAATVESATIALLQV
jgi:hypothetical protein